MKEELIKEEQELLLLDLRAKILRLKEELKQDVRHMIKHRQDNICTEHANIISYNKTQDNG
jgi:hypothetical protein